MSRELIESIVSNNMLEANDMVEAKLAEIRERKVYEMKRMFAAKMDEGILGLGLTKQQMQDRKKAGYERASKKLGYIENDKSEAKKNLEKIQKRRRESQKVEEGVVDDLKLAGKKAAKRTTTRLAVGLGHVIGKGISGAANVIDASQRGASAVKGAGQKAYGAALKGISDPLDTASKAAKGLGRAGATTAKATASGAKKAALAAAKSRIGQKIANYKPDAPGTAVVKGAKQFANAPVWSDLSRLSGL